MRDRFISGITVGFFVSLPWLALMYAGQRLFGWTHIPFEFFEFLSRALPGRLITVSIESLISFVSFTGIGQTSSTAKLIEFGIAYLLALFLLTLLGGIYAFTLSRLKTRWVFQGLFAGLILAALTILLSSWNGWRGADRLVDIAWLLATSLAWGFGFAWAEHRYWTTFSQKQDHERKRIITELAIGSLIISGSALAFGRLLNLGTSNPDLASNPTTPEPPGNLPTAPPTMAGFEPVPGTRPEVTPIEDFYRVDINLLPPGDAEFLDSSDPMVQRLLQQGGETDLPAESYILAIDGLVEKPLALGLSDLKAFPKIDQYGTLTCISNPVGGDLIGTTLFQGARLNDVLGSAGLKPGVIDIKFTCVDGYSESLPLAAALDPETLLCYSMGNQPLTEVHGAPIRLYTPGRYGIKNPKWIVRIEAIDNDYKGFWQQRGWTESGFIKTTSVIDSTLEAQDNQVLVGGIAFAGDRGIQGVELSVDHGSWTPAELDRPLSHLTWVIWRAALELEPGEHEISVRAIDGQGEIQTEKESKAQPNGATGHHSITISV